MTQDFGRHDNEFRATLLLACVADETKPRYSPIPGFSFVCNAGYITPVSGNMTSGNMTFRRLDRLPFGMITLDVGGAGD